MRNNVQYVYYSISQKQKIYIYFLRYLKNIYFKNVFDNNHFNHLSPIFNFFLEKK